MIRQLSIFAENKKGSMCAVTQVLADAGLNMNTLVTNDSAEFGIIRMLVSDPERAVACLEGAGYLCRTDRVIAAEIGDECGSLNALLRALSDGNINLDYLYVTYSGLSKRPVAIFRTADSLEVEEFLQAKGYNMLKQLQ